MFVNLVHIRIKKDKTDDFIEATLENARESRKEPLIARFDLVQETADPSCFVLIEVFRSEEAPAHHKETAHYKKWKETVEAMLAEERKTIRCSSVDPASFAQESHAV